MAITRGLRALRLASAIPGITLAACLPAWISPLLAAPPGTDLLGVWRVESVRNDRGATHRLAISDDDQRVVGRLLEFGTGRIVLHSAEGDAACATPSLSSVAETAGALIAETMAGRGAHPSTPLPADYGLSLAPDATVQAIWLKCGGNGTLGPGFGRGDTWFLSLPDHRMAMGYYASTVLVLDAVAKDAATQASFECGRAATPTEKAICASADLAGLDRSVAASYGNDLKQFAATGDPEATAKLRKSQREWLSIRDRCAADEGCLRKAMAGRLQALADTAAFTGE